MSTSKSPAMTGQVQLLSYSSPFTNVVTTPGTDANGYQMLTVTGTTSPQTTGYIGVNYAGDANYAPAINNDQVIVNIPDFALPASATISVTAGQTGTGTIQVTPLSSLPSTVSLGVQGAVPAGTTLTLSPTNVNLNGAAVPVTLTLTTTGTNGVQSNLKIVNMKAGFFAISRPTWWSVSLLCLFAAVYLCGIRGRQKRFTAAFLVLMLGVVTFGLGCGGGGSGGGGNGGGNGDGG
jgi:hypothetical protein